jgi:hypothetical protein
MLCFIDFANVMSLEMRMPPAIENAHPPMSMRIMNTDRAVLFDDGMLM